MFASAATVASLVKSTDDDCGCGSQSIIVKVDALNLTCLSVPEGEGDLCFDVHKDKGIGLLPDSGCCDSDTDHLHAHVHQGDAVKDVILSEVCTSICSCILFNLSDLFLILSVGSVVMGVFAWRNSRWTLPRTAQMKNLYFLQSICTVTSVAMRRLSMAITTIGYSH